MQKIKDIINEEILCAISRIRDRFVELGYDRDEFALRATCGQISYQLQHRDFNVTIKGETTKKDFYTTGKIILNGGKTYELGGVVIFGNVVMGGEGLFAEIKDDMILIHEAKTKITESGLELTEIGIKDMGKEWTYQEF